MTGAHASPTTGADRSAPWRRPRPQSSPLRPQGGQATVEFALVLPAVVIVVLLIFQVLVLGRDYLRVVDTTREAARAAAVDSTATRAVGAVTRDLPGATLSLDRNGETVTASVRYVAKTTLPIVGVLLPDVEMRRSLTMWIER